MRNTIQSMASQQIEQFQSIYVAYVEQTESGEATQVFITSLQKSISVFAHGSEVPHLHNGDQVLVMLTEQGAIVTQRLRKPGERPQQGFSVQPDGRLMLHNKTGIKLETDETKIELRADGRIYIDGKEIYAIADGKHRLQGATIELN
jgi:hypothetical protein